MSSQKSNWCVNISKVLEMGAWQTLSGHREHIELK